ncbi:MAG: SdpI family protein [Lachnospiraceae bacterium]|nr:SdpI family protein [Lachnospiraceae bacterium]
MKKLIWIVSFIPLIGTALVLLFMPDSVPMHYDSTGNIDRWGSKYENLIFPIIILAMTLLWALFIGYYEKKADRANDEKESAGARTNAKVIGIVGLSVTVMFTVMQGFILYEAYTGAVSNAERQIVDIGKVSCILLGVILIVLGNFMTKTRINGVAGFRINWSMYNDNTWRKSNRFGAFAIMVAGVLTIITAVLMKNSFIATMVMLGYILIASIMTVIYSHKVYVREVESENKGEPSV